MAESVKFSILGADEVSFKLKAVAYDVQFKGGRAALRKAANYLAEKVRENSQQIDNPATPGRSIPANVAVRWNRRRYNASGELAFRVGILGGAGRIKEGETLSGNPGGDTRYWRHVEFGTSRSRAQPFMRRALADNIDGVTSVFISEFGAALTRAIKRANK